MARFLLLSPLQQLKQLVAAAAVLDLILRQADVVGGGGGGSAVEGTETVAQSWTGCALEC